MPPLFSVSEVDLTFHSKGSEIPALRNITLEVHEEEFVSLVGPSGCGKSTLLRIMCGVLPPTNGTVSFDGQRVDAPLRKVGMAFQDPLLLPWRTVLDNILLPIEIMGGEKRKHADKAMELLRLVGLNGFESRSPWELSGGMRQRGSLCRALIHDPKVLLLDEPFGALDAFTREELWLIIQRLTRERRCTTVFVTHDLRESIFLSDRVLVLSPRPGRVIHEEVISIKKPRDLPITYAPDFTAHEKTLREKIGRGTV